MYYNQFERKIALILDNFPNIRQFLKRIYQRFQYILNKNTELIILKESNIYIQPVLKDTKNKDTYFFGYYDKSPWSICKRYYLMHILSNEERRNGKIKLAFYDLKNNEIVVFGGSKAWNYQQGSMLQWLPGSEMKVIFNDVLNDKLVSRILDPFSGKEESVIDVPIQAISPDGKIALTLNYKRLSRLRPEYGYNPVVNNFSETMDLSSDGIWKVDLQSGKSQIIVSLEQLTKLYPRKEMQNSEHKVNHIIFSPDGRRFAFMHRWIGRKGKFSRLYTANIDGSDLCLLADDRMVSHYSWKNEKEILAWARKEPWGDRYYLFQDCSNNFTIIGEGILDQFGDGHPSFSPDGKWIVTDTYPNKARMRSLLLWNNFENRLIIVGQFFAPWRFDGAERCDLHPRWNHDGTQISIDSVHEGIRRTYIIDVKQIVSNGNNI